MLLECHQHALGSVGDSSVIERDERERGAAPAGIPREHAGANTGARGPWTAVSDHGTISRMRHDGKRAMPKPVLLARNVQPKLSHPHTRH